jgi:protein-tyrosine phosphatase
VNLLFVCEHNLVRSPVAEACLADWARATRQPDLVVGSAGLRAKDGEPILREVLWAASSHQVSVRHHVARRLDEPLVDSSTLVLVMTEAQRGTVNMLAPQAFARTFTVRELLRLTDPADGRAVDVAGLAEQAHANRPLRPHPGRPEDVDDITAVTREAVQKVVDEVVVVSRDLIARMGAPAA